MKIEIEFEDVRALRCEVQRLQSINTGLEEKLKSLDENKLNEQACVLARKMFGDVIHRVFNDLGFKDKTGLGDIDFGHLQHYLGKAWWSSGRLNIVLGATITNQFKGAFLRMGIKSGEDI